jgi:hypothetical protein
MLGVMRKRAMSEDLHIQQPPTSPLPLSLRDPKPSQPLGNLFCDEPVEGGRVRTDGRSR